MRLANYCVFWLCGLCTAIPAATAQPPRYVGRTAHGQWISGDRLTDWHRATASPRLDGRLLLSSSDPLRWLVDQSLPLPRKPQAYVETWTGDRLPGTVLGYRTGNETPYRSQAPYFLVQLGAPSGEPLRQAEQTVRVLQRHVARIVWAGRGHGRQPTRTLLTRTGARIEFRALRFAAEAVRLLLDEGTRTLPYTEIAELHLQTGDPWNRYLDELSRLSPGGQDRLLHVQTTSGLVATTSMSRFAARVRGDALNSQDWWHGLQPAWSMDVLWVENSTIRSRVMFAPHEVPLVRLRPVGGSSTDRDPAVLWPWRLNLNAADGPLRSGGRTFGWGFGVYGSQQLRFRLPPTAVNFEVCIGLDHTAGRGGCAQARVRWSESDAPLHESPLLVGSQQFFPSGKIMLAARPQHEPAELLLQVDADPQQRPSAADGWEIRDFLNWGDPLLRLDPARLPGELGQQLPSQIAAWRGWELRSEPGRARGVNVETSSDVGARRFEFAVAAVDAPLVLRRQHKLGPLDRWLVINAGTLDESPTPSQLEVQLDGQAIGNYTLPVVSSNSGDDLPVAVSLARFAQAETLVIELRQLAAADRNPVLWKGIHFSSQHPAWHQLFEDELPDAEALTSKLRFSGRRALRLVDGRSVRLEASSPLRIRKSPGPGEYRFLRFAIRQQRPGGLRLELNRSGAAQPQWALAAGVELNRVGKVKSVLTGELPNRWLVITRDLVGDFGPCELEALTVSSSAGGDFMLDHVYLARRQSDLSGVSP